MLISRINCWISVGTAGRPRRRLDFQRQNNRKPARCHRTAVSGRTMASAPRAFGNRWQAQPRTTLSTAKNGIRFGLPRRNTMICCLSTRASASSAARDRNRSTTKPKISLQRSHIQRRIVRFSADCQPDQIYDRDSTSETEAWSRSDATKRGTRIYGGERIAEQSGSNQPKHELGYAYEQAKSPTLRNTAIA